MNLTNTYRDHTITYNGTYFEISLEGKTLTNKPKTLEACITWVDNQLKESWVRNPILVRDYRGEISKATATSVVDSEYLWVTYEKGQKREKIHSRSCLEVSETNYQKLSQIEEVTKKIKLLEQERRSIEDSLEQFDISKMYSTTQN